MMNYEMEISKKDMETIKDRVEDLMASLQGNTDLVDGLISYCAANGYTQDKATVLIKETIIPTVAEYNEGCRAVMNEDDNEWVKNKVSERCEGMSITEEYQYKAELICAIRAMDRDTLDAMGMLTGEEWEEKFNEICSYGKRLPEGMEATAEMLDNINEELAHAIESSTVALRDCEAFETMLESCNDEDRLKHFAGELWQDEREKYCMAAAACVAHHNHELESIPSDMDERILTVHCCKGMDIAAIESKAAAGEISHSEAYELIKGITIVSIGVMLAGAFIGALPTLAALSMIAGSALGGVGVLGAVVSACVMFGMTWCFIEGCEVILDITNVAFDVTVAMAKRASKAIVQVAREKVIPAIVSGFEYIKSLWNRAKDMIRRRNIVTCRA